MLATVRMKRLLQFLIPWMAITSAGWAQTRSAELVFTYFGSIRDRVFRVGNECYVPLDVLRSVGWQCEEREGTATVRVDERRARIALRRIADQPMVPMTELLDAVGLQGDWEPGTNKLDVFAPLNSVKYERGHLTVDAGLPVKSSLTVLKNPTRTVIDVTGAKMLPMTGLVLQDGAKIAQFKQNVVRITISGTVPNPELPADAAIAKSFVASLGVTSDPATIVTKGEDEDPPVGGVPVTTQIAAPNNQTFTGPQVQAGPLTAGEDGPTIAVLTLKLSRSLPAAPTFRHPEPSLLEIVLPNTTIDLGDGAPTIDPLAVESATTRMEGSNAVLSLKLVRPMGTEISFAGNDLQIKLLKPSVGDGRLAGKTVVIDAGHGGHDSGATTSGKELMEKNMTLAIAKLASAQLVQEGVTVIMTRNTDEFIPLQERSEIANRNHADFFISVHINSNGLDSTTRGGITFFHLKDPISYVLADCIQSQIKQVSGLPNLGVWSDGKIYKSGFAVLRYAKMPAVLIECGFINNATDRKRMMTDDFKQNIAGAIVKGLKVYLGQK
jgi:N-acetylmuramoyl-L-alanine amidase